jgi:hypothetical protein
MIIKMYLLSKELPTSPTFSKSQKLQHDVTQIRCLLKKISQVDSVYVMYVVMYLSYRNAAAQSDQEKQEGEIGEGVNRGE